MYNGLRYIIYRGPATLVGIDFEKPTEERIYSLSSLSAAAQAEEDEMIRVGLIGFGLAGRVFHAPLISSVEGLELAAVVERHTDHAAERYPGITTYRSLEAMLEDASLGLFVVATPSGSHFEVARQLLEAGKNVVVDKPLAVRSAEIAELMKLAAARGVLLAPFHNRRWDGDFLTVQRLLGEGSLGRLVHFESTFDRWAPGVARRPWKDDQDEGGGQLLDLGTHLADQALMLFGKPLAVSAEVQRERDGEGADDAFTLRLRYEGLWVVLGATCLSSLQRPRFHLRGTKGNYWKHGLDPQEDALEQDHPHRGFGLGPGAGRPLGAAQGGHRRRQGHPPGSARSRRLPALLRGHSRCAAGQALRG